MKLKSQSYSDIISNHLYYREMDKVHSIYFKIALDSLKIDEQKQQSLIVFYRVYLVAGWSEIYYKAYCINATSDTTSVLIRYIKNFDSAIIITNSDSVDLKKYSSVYQIIVNKNHLGFYDSDIFINYQNKNFQVFYKNNTTSKYFTTNYIYKIGAINKKGERKLRYKKMNINEIINHPHKKEILKTSKRIKKKYSNKLRNFQKNFKPLIFY